MVFNFIGEKNMTQTELYNHIAKAIANGDKVSDTFEALPKGTTIPISFSWVQKNGRFVQKPMQLKMEIEGGNDVA